MKAWTGGQYSLVRLALGSYLALHYALLVPWGRETFSSRGVLPAAELSPFLRLFPNVFAWYDGPEFVTAFLLAGVVLAIALAAGTFDRIAALGLLYVQACTYGRNPLIANPAIPFVGLMLVTHALMPPAPYGSWRARGRTRPAGSWEYPRAIYMAVWVVAALAYSYGGFTKLSSPSWIDGSALGRVLENPLARPGMLRDAFHALPAFLLSIATWGALALELLFAPLALVPPIRRWLWLAMVGMHLGLLAVVAFADLTVAMLVVHLVLVDPAWIPRRGGGSPERIFYDGTCGLCHRAVRFVLSEDPRGEAFRFAPLHGDTFKRDIDAAAAVSLPDSIVVATRDGRILSRSDGVIHILAALGGMWRVIGAVLRAVPRRLRDFGYDRVAAARKRLFAKPEDACPIVPADLRARFDP